MSSHNGITLKNMTYNGQKVKKWNHNDVLVFSAGSTVTYHVDTGVSYVEEVDSGASCLSPTTFTPTKSGWTFVGWREDTKASSSVLSSKVMDSDPIVLYAVFTQQITLSYNGNSSTSGSTAAQKDNRYYNNGNVVNPTFTLAANGFTRTNHTFTAWASGSASGMQYTAGTSVTLNANRTFYAVWTANSWYVFRNSAWTVDVSGTTLDSGWNKESGNDGSWGLYQYGMQNNSGANGSWGSVVIDTKGCKTLRVKVSNCRFENGTFLGVRNRSVSTDRIFTIETTGTHTFTLPDGCEKIQFVTWMPDGHWVYIDEIYLSA